MDARRPRRCSCRARSEREHRHQARLASPRLAWTPDGGASVLASLAASARTPAHRARSPARRTAQRAQQGHPPPDPRPGRGSLSALVWQIGCAARATRCSRADADDCSTHVGGLVMRPAPRLGDVLRPRLGLASVVAARRLGGRGPGLPPALVWPFGVGANAGEAGGVRADAASAGGRLAAQQGVSPPATQRAAAAGREAGRHNQKMYLKPNWKFRGV